MEAAALGQAREEEEDGSNKRQHQCPPVCQVLHTVISCCLCSSSEVNALIAPEITLPVSSGTRPLAQVPSECPACCTYRGLDTWERG